MMKYERPKIKKVVIENKKPVLGTCKVENSDTRGIGPCGSEGVCKVS